MVVAGVTGAVRFALAFDEADDRAGENAALSYADRNVGGGNSIVADQSAVFEARGRIPENEPFEVVVGEPVEGWSELTQAFVASWFRYDLLPRRPRRGAEWVICYACDRATLGEVEVVWEGDDGTAILRRGQ